MDSTRVDPDRLVLSVERRDSIPLTATRRFVPNLLHLTRAYAFLDADHADIAESLMRWPEQCRRPWRLPYPVGLQRPVGTDDHRCWVAAVGAPWHPARIATKNATASGMCCLSTRVQVEHTGERSGQLPVSPDVRRPRAQARCRCPVRARRRRVAGRPGRGRPGASRPSGRRRRASARAPTGDRPAPIGQQPHR